jgi:arylformamidase
MSIVARALSIVSVNTLMMFRTEESNMPNAFTPEFVEREYNNRALVPEHAKIFARWERDSDFVRATLAGKIDLPYGPDPRHRIDLFPAGPEARGTLVFVHGGYWRSLDKKMFSWLAAAWNAEGIHVAMPNYRFAPAVGLDDIVEDMISATNWLFANGARHGVTTDRVVVSGHSAGGHLTAALFAAPLSKFAFDPARIAGGVPLSGLFDLAPLRQFSFNSDFRLDAAAVERLSLLDKPRTLTAALIVAAGAAESSEFQRQSRDLATAWSPQVHSLLLLPGANHFTIVDAFAERGQPLFAATLGLFK